MSEPSAYSDGASPNSATGSLTDCRPPRRVGRFRHIAPVAGVLLIASAVTFWSWRTAERQASNQVKVQFHELVNTTVMALTERFEYYEAAARGVCGLFAASREVESEEWHAYLDLLSLPSHYPATVAILYAPRGDELKGDATMGEAPPASARVRYVEPRSRGAELEYLDLSELTTVQRALLYARDTDLPSLSGPLDLEGVPGGGGLVALCLPVYDNAAPRSFLVEDRREACKGWVVLLLDVSMLVRDIVGTTLDDLHVNILDGNALIHRYSKELKHHESSASTSAGRSETVYLGGRLWTLNFTAAPHLLARMDRRGPMLVLICGIVISLLLGGIVTALSMTRRRALVLAEGMTASLREREQDSRRLAEAAHQANRAKDHFLASMSHELRTPLHGVIGMTELLMDTPLEESQRRFAEACHSSGKTLLALINDILDLSKIESGRLELDSEHFQLERIMVELTDVLAHHAHRKGLELICDLDPRLHLDVVGDATRLRQVLLNLTGNAIKFTERGDIVIRMACASMHDEYVMVRGSVTDSGIGIRADRIDRLFLPFSQVDPSTTRKYGGTGLGLAICRNIIQLMGGEMGVNSREGEGSEFWFAVPLKLSRESSATPATAPDKLVHLRILVVDQNENSLATIAQMLESWSIAHHTATSLSEAMDALSAARGAGRPFDAALVDHRLFDERFVDRVLDGSAPPRLIVMAPMGHTSFSNESIRSRIDQVISKPFVPSALLDTLTNEFCEGIGAHAMADYPSASESNAVAAMSGANILVAEDNATNRMYVQEVLKRAGHRCHVVENGREAVETLGKESFDLVLMDCQMPEMDGFQATAEIRRREGDGGAGRRTPIVALTANAIQGDRERCLASGMDDYLTKPIEISQLLEMIRQYALEGDKVEAEASSGSLGDSAPSVDRPLDAEQVLARCMGDVQFLSETLRNFESEMPGYLAELCEAAKQRDAEAVAARAHAIKGAASLITAEALRDAAVGIEELARSGTLDTVEEKIDRVQEELKRCLAYLPAVREAFDAPAAGAADDVHSEQEFRQR